MSGDGSNRRKHFASQHAIYTYLARHLELHVIECDSDLNKKEVITSDLLERADSIITQDEVKLIHNYLVNAAANALVKVNKFEWTEGGQSPFEEPDAEPKDTKKRKRKPPSTGSSGNA